METLLLTRSDIARFLSMADCIEAVESAFRALGEGKVDPPQSLGVASRGGGFHVKAAIVEIGGRRYFAAKTNGNFPANPTERSLPTIQGLALLCDADDGRVLAVMDSLELTAKRTAAATAVAAKHLARREAETLALIGCGTQGYAHVEAMRAAIPFKRILAFDAQRGKAEALAKHFAGAVDIAVVDSVRAAAVQADAIVTCTTSYDFILQAADVKPGTFIGGVGVDNEQKKELHPGLMAASRVVVDLLSQCVKIGDLHHAVEAGTMQPESVHAELGEIVAGHRPGRGGDDETIIFDSTGLAIQDVAAAVVVYERARGGAEVQALAFTD